MRKLSKLLVIVFAFIMIFTLSACGDKADKVTEDNTDKEEVVDTIEGKFILSGMVEGEDVITKEQIESIGGNDFFVEFTKDKTFVISVSGEELTGTYELDGETVTMHATGEEDPLIAKLIGNDFIIEDEGMKMTFTRE